MLRERFRTYQSPTAQNLCRAYFVRSRAKVCWHERSAGAKSVVFDHHYASYLLSALSPLLRPRHGTHHHQRRYVRNVRVVGVSTDRSVVLFLGVWKVRLVTLNNSALSLANALA